MTLTKRHVLFALAALAAGGSAAAAQTAAPAIDLAAGRAIGEAYLVAHPEEVEVVNSARRPGNILDDVHLARLRTMAADDFDAGRVFNYQGWILSRTEGRLFALLAVV